MSTTDASHFTLANIPFGVASRKQGSKAQVVTRLREHVYFLPELIAAKLLSFTNEVEKTLSQSILNDFAALGRTAHRQVREALQKILVDAQSNGDIASCRALKEDVQMHLPIQVGDFSDFSLSRNHVLNAGLAVFGVESLPPGFLHFPIGYAGRSSSIVVSRTPVTRPLGQYRTPDGVAFGPSKAMDYELEVACVVGKPSQMGKPVKIDNAMEHVFGFALLNDWSARDIQGLEMNPLGPFNGKSVATTLSPWIITADALEPFKAAMQEREVAEAPYLRCSDVQTQYNVSLEVSLTDSTGKESTMCRSRLDWMYWSFRHMIAHQTINGCAIRSGDLLATGTVSGREQGTLGCLLESTRGGKQKVSLAGGGQRTYLEDGDTVRLTGWAGDLGSENCVGFGDCSGRLDAAIVWDDYEHSVNGANGTA